MPTLPSDSIQPSAFAVGMRRKVVKNRSAESKLEHRANGAGHALLEPVTGARLNGQRADGRLDVEEPEAVPASDIIRWAIPI